MPVERTLSFPGPASPRLTLAPQRRGQVTRCYQLDPDRAIWRTSLQNSGPVTARIRRTAPNTVTCQAWGDGADEFVEALPALLGLDDDAGDFTPHHPVIEAAHRRVPAPASQPHRTGVGGTGARGARAARPGADSFRSWRLLVTRSADRHPDPPRFGCGCHRRPMFGGASRRGSSTAPTSTPAGPAPSWVCPARAAALEQLAGRPVAAAATRSPRCPGRDLDGGRDRAAGVRRRRRPLDRGPPHRQDGRLDADRPSGRRRRHGRTA